MEAIWKALNYNIRISNINFRLSLERCALAGVIIFIYLIGIVFLLGQLYSLTKCQFLATSAIGNYAYIAIIWLVSAITTITMAIHFPGITYLDKDNTATRILYLVSGPLLYPKILCLLILLVMETSDLHLALFLLRKSPSRWGNYDIETVHSVREFINSVVKYKKYLRE